MIRFFVINFAFGIECLSLSSRPSCAGVSSFFASSVISDSTSADFNFIQLGIDSSSAMLYFLQLRL